MEEGGVGTYGLVDAQYFAVNTSTPNYSQIATLACQGACADVSALVINITVNEGLGGNLEGNLSGSATFNDAMMIPYATEFAFEASWRLPIMQ